MPLCKKITAQDLICQHDHCNKLNTILIYLYKSAIKIPFWLDIDQFINLVLKVFSRASLRFIVSQADIVAF